MTIYKKEFSNFRVYVPGKVSKRMKYDGNNNRADGVNALSVAHEFRSFLFQILLIFLTLK